MEGVHLFSSFMCKKNWGDTTIHGFKYASNCNCFDDFQRNSIGFSYNLVVRTVKC
jgi:hypothetical protein